jgi:cytidine deaminase
MTNSAKVVLVEVSKTQVEAWVRGVTHGRAVGHGATVESTVVQNNIQIEQVAIAFAILLPMLRAVTATVCIRYR